MAPDIRDTVLAARAMAGDVSAEIGPAATALQRKIMNFGPVVQEIAFAVRGTGFETEAAEIQRAFVDLGVQANDVMAKVADIRHKLERLAIRMNGGS